MSITISKDTGVMSRLAGNADARAKTSRGLPACLPSVGSDNPGQLHLANLYPLTGSKQVVGAIGHPKSGPSEGICPHFGPERGSNAIALSDNPLGDHQVRLADTARARPGRRSPSPRLEHHLLALGRSQSHGGGGRWQISVGRCPQRRHIGDSFSVITSNWQIRETWVDVVANTYKQSFCFG